MKFTQFETVYAAALGMLPAKMNSAEAKAMMIAIALQESRFEHRRQIEGPAHGFWQFEAGGAVYGVLRHEATRDHIRVVCDALCYKPEALTCYYAIEHNDILAAAFARLLLWSLPGKLPARGDAQLGWQQYLDAWRPGKPHADTWPRLFAEAWDSM